VESLVAEDHPARSIWIFLSRLDLGKFSEEQRAVEGDVGRSAISPHLLLSIWIYSYARGVSSARQISREMEHEPGLQWLAGMEVVNHHTLSDFRVAHGSALQHLMEQVLGVLFSEGLVGLERVTQDGTKIRAQASKRSFVDGNIFINVLISPNATLLKWRPMTSITSHNNKRQLATASNVSAKQNSSLHCNH